MLLTAIRRPPFWALGLAAESSFGATQLWSVTEGNASLTSVARCVTLFINGLWNSTFLAAALDSGAGEVGFGVALGLKFEALSQKSQNRAPFLVKRFKDFRLIPLNSNRGLRSEQRCGRPARPAQEPRGRFASQLQFEDRARPGRRPARTLPGRRLPRRAPPQKPAARRTSAEMLGSPAPTRRRLGAPRPPAALKHATERSPIEVSRQKSSPSFVS